MKAYICSTPFGNNPFFNQVLEISRIARLGNNRNHGVARNAAVGPINHGVPAPSNGLPRGGRRLLHCTSTALPSISVKFLHRISSAIFVSYLFVTARHKSPLQTPVEESLEPAPSSAVVADTKASFTEPKNEGSSDDGEPPPPYTEGYSPLESFTYVMAAAGGASSIITQVQQTGGPPINTLGDIGGDEHVGLDLRGTRFTLSRDELLTLPEFVLLSLFPNGLLPDGHAANGFHDGDVFPVDYDPVSLQYMLDFFRTVAQTIPASLPSSSNSPEMEMQDPLQGSARDMLQDRAGIIVLREDLDFYVIPPYADIGHDEMLEVKRAAGRSLLKQDGIFSGLRKSEEIGSTEQHLIEMLTAGGFDRSDQWGHRAPEPNKAVICSLALAKLRTDIRGDLSNNNSVGMAQKLLLFWRKPARRCWWEGIELDDVEGVEGQVKVWIRRVWTLEMSVIGLR
ncbi:hypothetical protein DTO013E5_4030 [Penicillium roqueforti]|nr:hypothetical protein CBS147337_2871 [Penicillium roqueforti]KAI2685217.1 hypothetical protein LCP963914a_4544 [Penicillium roqueforti]KAI2729816.1 hypothetical protein CBS147354_1201 [Penicillium roqueforti]KAI2748212.1 hypothetical protein DTO012A1_858 [Penicillium roqueforti]KAI2754948.1 hypothetical protein DTO013F2_1440 [Penicillium roqueforti]